MTDIYGIFGFPVAHSRSPAMHTRAFAKLGIDAVYLRFAVAPGQLLAAVSGMRALGLAGVNITLPHKTQVMALLDRVEPDALAIGAVNTIFRDGELLCGTNTDAGGLSAALREAGVSLSGARVLVLGAGGAARASVVGLGRAGASSIGIAARRQDEAQALVAALAAHTAPCKLHAVSMDAAALARAFADTDVLVQATSATLAGAAHAASFAAGRDLAASFAAGRDLAASFAAGRDLAASFAAALPLQALPAHAWVTDLVYKPLETSVLASARARGLRTLDGLGMLLHQGALAFERWTGQPAPLAEMRDALKAETG